MEKPRPERPERALQAKRRLIKSLIENIDIQNGKCTPRPQIQMSELTRPVEPVSDPDEWFSEDLFDAPPDLRSESTDVLDETARRDRWFLGIPADDDLL